MAHDFPAWIKIPGVLVRFPINLGNLSDNKLYDHLTAFKETSTAHISDRLSLPGHLIYLGDTSLKLWKTHNLVEKEPEELCLQWNSRDMVGQKQRSVH